MMTMDLVHRSLAVQGIICLIAFLLLPGWHAEARLYFFAPFLVTSYYQCGYISCLWLGIICGVFIDLFSDLPFGINAFVYCLTTHLLYRRKRHFFSDRVTTLTIMTFLFALTATLLFWIVLYLLGDKTEFSIKIIFGDFIVMPFFDALYAMIFFTLPVLFFGKRLRRGSDYFMRK